MCDGSVQRAIGLWAMTEMKVEAAMAMIEYIDDIRSCFFAHSGMYPYIITAAYA
jgi:hypothetical protein